MAKECAICHYVGKARSSKSNTVFLLLLCCGVWPGVLYGFFYNPPANICPKCGAAAMVAPAVDEKSSSTKKQRERLTARKAASILKRVVNGCFWAIAALCILLSTVAYSDPKAPTGVTAFFFIIAPLFLPPVHRLVYRAVAMKLAPTKFQKDAVGDLSIDEESEFLLGD